MPPQHTSRSFDADDSNVITLDSGQVAHRGHVAQSDLLARHFYTVRPGVWCLVGNGLSNQTFIEGPEGIIAIDTGESVQEMGEALTELRVVTDAPVVAVLYTHFHYVSGTTAVFDENPGRDIPVFGHERINANLQRATTEIAPTYVRGLAEQFALMLPASGPDGLVNVGLGRFFRNPAHAPFTPGYVPATQTFTDACSLRVAGLDVRVTPAPSDADDSVTYWFPSIGVAVNNLVWPVLFNIFAIRGEEYRDPRIMLTGLDHLLSLGAEHLVGAHGPPISGAQEITERVTRYRDSIQFLWDQTVRHTNRGLTANELAHTVRLPDSYDADNLTSELYGVAEHHVRQIRNGLFGFFDGDEANLFPLATAERSARMIAGFGGPDAVRYQLRAAIDADDLRWALELGSWLVQSSHDEDDRRLLAEAVRLVGQRSSAANIRNWCLTRALLLEGRIDDSRFRTHQFQRRQVLAAPLERSVHLLRVMLDPAVAEGVNVHLGWRFGDGTTAGLHVRNCVACPTDGSAASVVVECEPSAWADVLTGTTPLSQALATGTLRVIGDTTAAVRALGCFDVEGLRA